jgi:hypothetical protein
MATTPVVWDSFNTYAAPAEMNGHLAVAGSSAVDQVADRSRTGNGSLVLVGGSSIAAGATLTHGGLDASYIVVNCAYYIHVNPTNARAFIEIQRSGSPKARVVLNTNGTLRLDVGTTQVDVSVSAVVLASINYFELVYRSDAVAGELALYLNGVLVADFSGDTVGVAGNVQSVVFRSPNNTTGTTLASRTNISDVVISTVTGTPTPAEARLGAVIHSIIVPTSDVAVDGTPSAGSDNFAMVDEVPNDGDATHVELAAPGDRDLYAHSSTLPADTQPIGVAVFSVQRLPSGGTTQVRHQIDNGTSTAEGADLGVGGTYAAKASFWSESPFTTAEWSKSEVEALRFGVEARV